MDKSIETTKGSNGNPPSSIADPQGQPEPIPGIHVNKDQADDDGLNPNVARRHVISVHYSNKTA
ncbi:hypothetical protein PVK06_041222 [Gossypium arboreum]|uniref:Uncharacterized protein n=1 Tax=Gossypium arboreum TaxID=29729 RepID=A0ABR0N9U3_GOSAR|nr:hypothetical protein PVK06_041222 [Gossypium arboreum]